MLIDYHRVHPSLTNRYSYQHLDTVQWLGDNKMGDFIMRWRHVMLYMPPDFDQTVLNDKMLTEVRKSNKLAHDVAMFDRLPLDDPNRNAEYFLVAMERQTEREREVATNNAEINKLKNNTYFDPLGGGTRNPAAAGEGGGGNGRGKGK